MAAANPLWSIISQCSRTQRLHQVRYVTTSTFSVIKTGAEGTSSYQVNLLQSYGGKEQHPVSNVSSFQVSPWHHIPLFPHLLVASESPPNSQQALYPCNYQFNRPHLESAFMMNSTDNTHDDWTTSRLCGRRLEEKLADATLADAMAKLFQHPEHGYVVNMVTEIPKTTREKFEIAASVPGNPIKQDRTADGSLRTLCGPPIGWNYGAIPQTWEPPFIKTKGFKGDNDPLDIIEIGSGPLERGRVTLVQVLGCLGMIDQSEMDWKIIGIRQDEYLWWLETPQKWLLYSNFVINTVREWLRAYKVGEGKPLNHFLYNEQLLSPAQAMVVIAEMHYRWRQLISGAVNSAASVGHHAQSDLWIPLHCGTLPTPRSG